MDCCVVIITLASDTLESIDSCRALVLQGWTDMMMTLLIHMFLRRH
jgi:hypothetical protein